MHHLDECLDAFFEPAVAELIGEYLHAGESADRDLCEQGRVDVVADCPLGLRRGELVGNHVDPAAQRAANVVMHLGVAGEFLDQFAQRRRAFALVREPGEHPGRREEAVDGVGVLRAISSLTPAIERSSWSATTASASACLDG